MAAKKRKKKKFKIGDLIVIKEDDKPRYILDVDCVLYFKSVNSRANEYGHADVDDIIFTLEQVLLQCLQESIAERYESAISLLDEAMIKELQDL